MPQVLKTSRRMLLPALLLASTAPCAVLANPQGGTVSAGSASINSSGNTLTVTQATDKAIIDWHGFDIAVGETTSFVQPSRSSMTLNRVNSASASVINGMLTANGNVVVVNRNGVLFGKNAVVNIGGLLATTADIDNAQFMAGNLAFNMPGNPDATIENQGTITAQEAGLVGFVAPNVKNSGVIDARLGRVQLASGDTVTVDFYGDGLMEVEASPALQSQVAENTGIINAEGGTIAITAAAAAETVNSLINVSGELNATGIETKRGRIYIYAEGSNAVWNNVTPNKGIKSGRSVVRISGKLNASNATGTGGIVKVLGDNVSLANTAIINANGSTGGGTIHIGGEVHGTGLTPTSLTTIVEEGAFISANATQCGNGGEVIVWSDVYTNYLGSIEAKGGSNSGNGGFAEVSGKEYLRFEGVADLSAANGSVGTLLLDPRNVTISTAADVTESCVGGVCTPTGDDSILNVTTLQTALASSNVTVNTGSDGVQTGNITVANNLTWATGNLLTLSAAGGITINAGVTISNTYAGTTFGAGSIPVVLALRADNTGAVNGSGVSINTYGVTNNGTINMSASKGAVSIFNDIGFVAVNGTQTANGTWAAPANRSVSTQFTTYNLVNGVGDLTGITLSNKYALGTSIDGAGAAFNGNTPLGTFTGILDGQWCALAGGSNCGITNFTMTSAAANVGLFGASSGIIRNLGFDLTVLASNNAATTYVGGLTGTNTGTIANVASTGNVSYTSPAGAAVGVYLGGLVGYSNGGGAVIINSSNTGSVTYTDNNTSGGGTIYVGGLVGNNNGSATSAISGSWASGAVTAQCGTTCTYLAYTYIGGLAGRNQSSTAIVNSYTTGNVSSGLRGTNTSTHHIGGLVGTNSGTIDGTGGNYSYATGAVTYTGDTGVSGVGNLGGLIGYNYGAGATINNAYATGAVTYNNTRTGAGSVARVGGLVGYNTSTAATSVSNSWVSGAVTAQYSGAGSGTLPAYVGGLIGENGDNTATSISNSYATGDVSDSLTGNYQRVGGLVGYNYSSSATSISNTYATGNVNYDVEAYWLSGIGGLVGYNLSGTISDSHYITGTVTSAGSLIGGFVGTNSGTINNSYTTSNVVSTGDYMYDIGGFAGFNGGTISSSSATGTVTGGAVSSYQVGGFIGTNNSGGIVSSSSATGNVTGTGQVGGLIGANFGSVTSSYATGNATATEYAGGLFGYNENYGVVSGNYATGTISGTDYVGGLAGYNDNFASFFQNYATGNVSGTNFVGGLIGLSNFSGSISLSFATGNVNGITDVGGLVGSNAGAISDAYATGSVTAGNNSTYTGGLVGLNDTTGSISTSYATGSVTVGGGSTDYGGLVGGNNNTVTDSFWDTTTTGRATSAGGTGLATAGMKDYDTFSSLWNISQTGTTTPSGATSWVIYDAQTYPLLKTYMTALSITGSDASRSYDGTAYSGGNGITYSPAGPNGAFLLGSQTYGGAAQGSVNAGSYAITPQGLYSSQMGYDITYVSGTLTTSSVALSLTVTANNQSKTYGAAANLGTTAFTSNVTSGTLYGSDAVTSATLTSGGAAGTATVGTYNITPSAATGTGLGNYTITYTYVDGVLTVNPAALTITADNRDKVYGSALTLGTLAFTLTTGSLCNGDAISGVTLTSVGADAAAAVGSYSITPSAAVGSGLTNYTLSYADGALTVTSSAPSSPSIPRTDLTGSILIEQNIDGFKSDIDYPILYIERDPFLEVQSDLTDSWIEDFTER